MSGHAVCDRKDRIPEPLTWLRARLVTVRMGATTTERLKPKAEGPGELAEGQVPEG